jgi:hypothetical protein
MAGMGEHELPEGIDIDHPAVGAVHVFVPGSADSLAAAAFLVSRGADAHWVTVAREHRLPRLLERPLTDGARSIWCLGYAGQGNPLMPPALEAHVTHRRVHWLSTTSGRLSLAAAEVPGVDFQTLPGGSLVALLLACGGETLDDEERAWERLGWTLGRYPGFRPDPPLLALADRLHAASVTVRNHEDRGPELVRLLSACRLDRWHLLPELQAFAAEGEELIRRSRWRIVGTPPTRGGHEGPALWRIDRGLVARGAHGKVAATLGELRQAPVIVVEDARSGVTKAWVVLPVPDEAWWLAISGLFARYSHDFSYTGSRGAGAVQAPDVPSFIDAAWALLSAGPGS